MLSKHDFYLIADIQNPFDNRKSLSLFENPEHVICAQIPDQLDFALKELDSAEKSGKYLAGYISYEAACAINNPENKLLRNDGRYPMLVFGVFDSEKTISPEQYENFNGQYYISKLTPEIGFDLYRDQFKKIKNFIFEGETYQINFTFPSSFHFFGDTFALYKQLKKNQHSSFNFFMKYNDVDFLSLSPELFFSRSGNRIMSKPMKGTLEKFSSPVENQNKISEMLNCEKNKAENAMITDVFRNDFGKICRTGSVKVERFFEIEEYPTLYQATSTVSGELMKNQSLSKILKALLPSASVTGAPKLEAIKKIHELEATPRGIYTGAFGLVRPNGEALFNVAIRTLEINKNQGRAGFGSGIVFNSEPDSEYNEVLLKSRFIHTDNNPFFIFETILVQNGKYILLNYHLDRLRQSAEFFKIPFDYKKAAEYLYDIAKRNLNSGTFRLKLVLNEEGKIETEFKPFNKIKKKYKVAISPVRINQEDIFLKHKTSRRELYDNYYTLAIRKGYDDILFFNKKDEASECSIHNLIVKIGNGWFTPPLSSGLLPGVFRRYMLDKKFIQERIITKSDLKNCAELAVINSLRKISRAELDFFSESLFK